MGTRKPLMGDADEDAEVRMPMSGFVAIVCLRQLISPVIGILIAVGVLRSMLGVNDPVVLLVGMLQTAGPPMINLGVMAGLSGSGQTTVAKLLLFSYSASIV